MRHRLPMPYDGEAQPYLFCQQCRTTLLFGPFFGQHPSCQRSSGPPCLIETRYHAAEIKDSSSVENRTPLISPNKLKKQIGIAHLFLKNETVLPTYSWKDRVNEVHARLAKKWRFKKVQTISTGNHGISLAAQARRQGIACHVFVHPQCPEPTRQFMRYFGATLTPYGDHPHAELRKAVE